MKLLWLDCETNGLDPQNHRLLEVAALVTDLITPLRQEGSTVQGVLPVSSSEAESFAPFIIDMHTKNGLLLACKELHKESMRNDMVSNATRVATRWPGYAVQATRELEEHILALIPKVADVGRENITALAGSSAHFDLAFLRVHMPTLAANLSHRIYDVSAVKLFCRSLGMPKLPPEEAHRALPDVQESMHHAQVCMRWLAETSLMGQAHYEPLPGGDTDREGGSL